MGRIFFGAAVLLAIAFGCYRLWTQHHPSVRLLFTDDQRRLIEADRIARRGDRQRSQPMYRELESRFAAIGDNRDAIYAHISRLRGDLEHTNLQVLSLYLATELRQPEVQKDPHLKIRCLEVKGSVDLNLDGVSARPDFEELEKVADQVGEKQIAARASGDLGIVAFLEGNTSEAKWRIARAIASSVLRRDAAAESRYLTLFGVGMVQQHHPAQALWALNKAISIAEDNSDVVAVPEMAYLGKVQALSQLGRDTEASALIRRAQDYAIRSNFVGYQADLLVETGRFDANQNKIEEAIQVFERAARLSATISYNRGVADANAELAALYRQIGDLRKAADSAERCVAAHKQLGELYQIPHHLAIQAEIETAAGEFAQAEQTYSNAEEVIKLMLTHAPSTGSKRGVINAMSEVFLGHFELAANYEKDLPKHSASLRRREEGPWRTGSETERSDTRQNRLQLEQMQRGVWHWFSSDCWIPKTQESGRRYRMRSRRWKPVYRQRRSPGLWLRCRYAMSGVNFKMAKFFWNTYSPRRNRTAFRSREGTWLLWRFQTGMRLKSSRLSISRTSKRRRTEREHLTLFSVQR